ncbi:MAG: DUF481 domain-containing protein [Planctomycetota bacterium]
MQNLLACAAGVCIAATASSAQVPDETDPGPPPPVAAPENLPPEPRSDDYDWMQFNNGEWLKGDIKDLLDDTFIFDSDELDKQTLDMEDIYGIYSPRLNTVMLQDRTVVRGRLFIEGDSVTVITEEGEELNFTRDQVRSVIPGGLTEWDFWSGRIGLGATVRRGNVDQTDLTANVFIERRDPSTRLTLQYDGAYSVVQQDRTTNNHRASLAYDIYAGKWASDRLYFRPIQVVYFRDEFQNIDYRITPSFGLGYDIIDESRLEWSVTGAFGWEFERFIEAPPGGAIEEDDPALIAGTKLDWEATSDIDLGFDFSVTIPTRDTSRYNFRLKLYAEIELTDDFDLDIQLIWDRNNSPTPLSDGTVPETDDVRLVLGVAYEF